MSGSEQLCCTETTKKTVINALRLGFWTHRGVSIRTFSPEAVPSHMFLTWMLSSENAVDHGRHVGTDGVRLDVIMVGTWVLCGNGRSSSGRYHGWHMDALLERTEFVWTLSWLAHGCSVGTDGVRLDVIMVGTWVLCGNGRSSSGRYHGWHMDALLERTEFVWTLSWLAHGCSVGTDGVRLDVIMVGTWVLCGNGRSSSGRYHGWHMGAL